MRIAVFGTGAVGGYFGGRLAEAGEDVVFLARGAHLAAIRENGLRVTSVAGDFLIRPAHATDDPATVGPVDGILLGVKAWQVADAAASIRPMVGPGTLILPLQNGVEAPGILADGLGAEHVLGGLCRIFAYVVEPGHIRHQGVEPDIAFGELNGTRTDRVETLRRAFARARGVTVAIPPDIRAALWSKFLFIATLSGLGAITRAPIGAIRSLPETRRMLEQGLREIELLARTQGVALAPDVVSKTLAFIDGLPPDGTASMQRDIMEGRPSELESQNGAVVRLGQQAGVDVSLHRFIYHALLAQERKARGQIE